MKCKTCGVEFELGPGENARKYCSVKCRRKMERILLKQRNGERIGERKCEFCGRTFSPKRTIDVCCSSECRKGRQKILKKEYRKAHLVSNHLQPRKCEFCGKEYAPQRRNQRFCSFNCGRKGRYFENAEELNRRVAMRRKARREMLSCNEYGLTFGQMREIDMLQDRGNSAALFEASKKWTPAQRKYAKKRYMRVNGFHSYKFE